MRVEIIKEGEYYRIPALSRTELTRTRFFAEIPNELIVNKASASSNETQGEWEKHLQPTALSILATLRETRRKALYEAQGDTVLQRLETDRINAGEARHRLKYLKGGE